MVFRSISNEKDLRLCVVMVGLPARGKSFISQKIIRYLSWLSIPSKCFNIGTYRRDLGITEPNFQVFSFTSDENFQLRERAMKLAFDDILKWFNDENGVVAILDATNSTNERREWIKKHCEQNNIHPMFLESYCDDNDLVSSNVIDIASTSPYYEKVTLEQAKVDFWKRIDAYKEVYRSLSLEMDQDISFVKLINVSDEVIINKIQTYLESRIVFYVMNIRIKPKCIWLSRHGESIYNLEQKIGGDSDLSERGFQYAKKLKDIVKENAGNVELSVWTSTLKRTQQTAQYLPYKKKLQWKALDELDAGVCDGMTYEEIEEIYPDDFKARDDDKYEYRYRGGESYRDVVIRLEPIIMELERQENVLIITHQAVLRCIYAYFMNVPQEESPWMSIPLHTLIKLEPRAYGTKVTRIKANIPAVSTYKDKGTSHVGERLETGLGAHSLLTDTPEIK